MAKVPRSKEWDRGNLFNLGLKDKEDFVMCIYSMQREKMGNADRCDIFGVG